MRIIIILLLYSITLSTYGQSSQEVGKIKEEARITLDAYINYLSSLGNISESFADRNQSYRDAFYTTFYSTSDATLCYNDLDPEEKTSVYSSAKDYTDHVLHWYNQGLSTRFIGEPQFGKVATANGVNYIPVFVKKEIRGNYMQRRLHNKQYDLEFRLTYTRSSMGSIGNVKIASIKPASGGNNYKEEDNIYSAEELYAQAKPFYDQKNYTKAFPLMKQAAEKGNADAQEKLGFMYQYGYGVAKNLYTKEEWHRKAIKSYIKAAEKGDANAQFSLGNMYYQGYVTTDFVEAVKWYIKSAQQGNEYAQAKLGYMYTTGIGVKQNYTEAIKWFQKSAQQGNKYAQSNLALMYQNGRGVTKNISLAVEWYQKAARQDDDFAQKTLKRLGYSW